MEIHGTVISYTGSTKIQKQGGGSYDAWELVYRNEENEVKQLAKPVTGLRFNKPLKASLEALKPNDPFTVVLEKSDKGFWEVKELAKGELNGAAVSNIPAGGGDSPSRPVVAPRVVNRVTGSTYETAEERAKKQVVIIRQSCLAQALNFAGGESPIEAVLEHAVKFETFVYAGLEEQAKAYLAITLKDPDVAASN
jgi:hypothetical protein